ncbi:Plasmodium exported protein (PHISTc), unknown function [Plasmodium gaboni]|uniref:Plasmodium RESA N-terminal domain-containing protein n=1 Tax=Plasmodium gaboni TaxID=647221 RepID=A0ABY1UME0_9APIC|nr:Plasmodium exported protein (PHISTc), unknown function [Plasmodium gaboni]
MEYLKKTLFVSEKNKLWMKKERQYKKNRSRNYIRYRSLTISLLIFVYLIFELRYDNSGENTYNSNDSIVRNRNKRILSESFSDLHEYDNDGLTVEESDDSSIDILEDFSISPDTVNNYDDDSIDENVDLMSFIEVTEVLSDDQKTPPESNVDYVVTEVDDIIDEEEDKKLKEEYERILWKRRGISTSHQYHILTSSSNEITLKNLINEKALDHIELLHNETDSDSYNVLTEEDIQNVNSSYNNEKYNNNHHNNKGSTSANLVNTYELPNGEFPNNSYGLNDADIVNMNLLFNRSGYSSLENIEEKVEKINEDCNNSSNSNSECVEISCQESLNELSHTSNTTIDTLEYDNPSIFEINEQDEEEFERMLHNLKNNGTLGNTCTVWNKFCSNENKKFYKMQMNLWHFCEILAFEYNVPQSTLAKEWKKIVTYTNEELIQKNLTDFSDFNNLVFDKIYDTLDFINFIIHKRESWKQFIESEESIWKNTLERNFENYIR